MERRRCLLIGLGFAAFFAAQPGFAQGQPPDAGTLLRRTDPAQRPPPQAADLPPPKREDSASQASDAVRVHISRIRVIGSTRYDDAEWQRLLGDVANREASYSELRRAADRVTQRYRSDGWLARAYLPEQSLTDGVLTIAVVEAKLGAVRVEGPPSPRVSEERIRGTLVAGQKVDKEVGESGRQALELDELERAALLLEELPGIRSSIMLAPGAQPGETDILARIDNERLVGSSLAADNGGVEATGRARFNGELRLESPLHFGDELAGFFDFSEGTAYGRVSYELPLGTRGLRLRPAVSRLDYDLGGRFASLDARGRAETWSLTALYPLIRGNRVNARVSAGYEERRYENRALGLQTSRPKVDAFQGTLSLEHADGLAGGGLNQLALQLTRGDLDLSGNTTDFGLDAATARSDGSYTKVAWSIARLQRLSGKDRLLINLRGQLASRNLGSSERMSLGGMNGVRAYPVLEGTGDEGWIATTEWIHSLAQGWRVSAFYDYGSIAQHRDTWAGWDATRPDLDNRYALHGFGTSVGWSHPRGIELLGTVATRASSNPARDVVTRDDSDGTRREPQFWITSRWQF